jgi:hypothetical protein
MVEQLDEDHVGGHVMMVINLRTWKRRKRKTKWAQGKGIIIGPFCFGDRDTIESVITFRIDGRTIKRGSSYQTIRSSSVTRCWKTCICILGLVHNR